MATTSALLESAMGQRSSGYKLMSWVSGQTERLHFLMTLTDLIFANPSALINLVTKSNILGVLDPCIKNFFIL